MTNRLTTEQLKKLKKVITGVAKAYSDVNASRKQEQENEQLVQDIFSDTFSELSLKLNSINEEWENIDFDISLLSNEEKDFIEKINSESDNFDNFYNFQFETCLAIAEHLGMETSAEAYARAERDALNYWGIPCIDEEDRHFKYAFISNEILNLNPTRFQYETDDQVISICLYEVLH
jgi:hypothetical protein